MIDVENILKAFFEEILEETYEGTNLKDYLDKPKNEQANIGEVWDLYNAIFWHTPEELSYLPTIRELFKDKHIHADEREKLLKNTFEEPFKNMVKSKFYETIGLDVTQFKKNQTYIHSTKSFSEQYNPKVVVLLEIYEQQLNYCQVYDLSSDVVMDSSLTNLIDFDFETYKEMAKTWKINHHKEMLKNLQS